VLLSNTVDSKLGDISTVIMNILYDEPFQLPRRPIFPVLLKTVMNEGVSMAVEEYATMKSEHEAEFDFGEEQLNMLGYQLLELERYDDAIVIFALNVDSYPTNSIRTTAWARRTSWPVKWI